MTINTLFTARNLDRTISKSREQQNRNNEKCEVAVLLPLIIAGREMYVRDYIASGIN